MRCLASLQPNGGRSLLPPRTLVIDNLEIGGAQEAVRMGIPYFARKGLGYQFVPPRRSSGRRSSGLVQVDVLRGELTALAVPWFVAR
jgi:hypothetical protein